jgi:hypothetical protein
MSEPNGLQLEHAEFERPPAAECSSCKQPLRGAYYQVNGKIVCRGCSEKLQSAFAGSAGIAGIVRAILAGAVAAVAGGLLYYLVLRLTGYEFGLIAIVVGFGVGKAVNWGSGGRGGAIYQAIAIALTYLSIVGGYVPVIHGAFRELGGDLGIDVGWWPIVKLAIQTPFLGGFENIIGLVIIAIGLYEAWKFNQPAKFEVTGPHAFVPAATA